LATYLKRARIVKGWLEGIAEGGPEDVGLD
jgi:hypothetical protein